MEKLFPFHCVRLLTLGARTRRAAKRTGSYLHAKKVTIPRDTFIAESESVLHPITSEQIVFSSVADPDPDPLQ